MSRTIMEVPIKESSVDDVLHIIASILEPSGYKQKLLDGETIWAKGDGVMISMQCFGAVFTDHSVLLQGWMKDALLGESALEGWYGALVKKNMKKLLENIRLAIIANL